MNTLIRLDFENGRLVAVERQERIVRCADIDIPAPPAVPLRARQAERPTLAGRWALLLAEWCPPGWIAAWRNRRIGA